MEQRPLPEARERFDASWLALREPIDHRSRDVELSRRVAGEWNEHGWKTVVDLGSGTGSNLRYLAPRLSLPQSWILVDRDLGLLREATVDRRGVEIIRVVGDLAGAGLAAVAKAELVTASALMDIVSESWLRALVKACSEAGTTVLLTLSYDGTIVWGGEGDSPGDPLDDSIQDWVNTHQRRDKGLGPALGPRATRVATTLFHEAGFRTWIRPSPWRLGRGDADLTAMLVAGWERAALEEEPSQADPIRSWARRKQERIRTSEFSLSVGHDDLLAVPGGRSVESTPESGARAAGCPLA